MTAPTFLSIQSCVSYGHVGNSAVTFPLQRLGVRVWPIHTVLFSNHTGYGKWKGQICDVSVVRSIFEGVKDRGALHTASALLSGYMGSPDLGFVILDILKELKQINPALIYCCDPVMGDVGRGFFVPPAIQDFFKNNLIQQADIITPNHFELEFLSETHFDTIEGAVQAARKVMAMGPSVVLVTSLVLAENMENSINMMAVDKNSVYLVTTPNLPLSLNGAGDLTAALFSHFYIKYQDISLALEHTISRVFSLITETYKNQSRELVLIEAQENLINPEYCFKSVKISETKVG